MKSFPFFLSLSFTSFTTLFIGQDIVNIYSAGSKVKSKMTGQYKQNVCGKRSKCDFKGV